MYFSISVPRSHVWEHDEYVGGRAPARSSMTFRSRTRPMACGSGSAASRERSSRATAPNSRRSPCWPGRSSTTSPGTSLHRAKPMQRILRVFLTVGCEMSFSMKPSIKPEAASQIGPTTTTCVPARYPPMAANLPPTSDRLRNPNQLRRSHVAPPAPDGVNPTTL